MKKEYLEQERRDHKKCRRCGHYKIRHYREKGCTDYKGFFDWLSHGFEVRSCECEEFVD